MASVLLDKNIPVGLRLLLPGHAIETTQQRGWGTLVDGALIDIAEQAGFDVMLTADQSLPHQQNLTGRSIGIVVLNTNLWRVLRIQAGPIASAIAAVSPGEFLFVRLPTGPRRLTPRG